MLLYLNLVSLKAGQAMGFISAVPQSWQGVLSEDTQTKSATQISP